MAYSISLDKEGGGTCREKWRRVEEIQEPIR